MGEITSGKVVVISSGIIRSGNIVCKTLLLDIFVVSQGKEASSLLKSSKPVDFFTFADGLNVDFPLVKLSTVNVEDRTWLFNLGDNLTWDLYKSNKNNQLTLRKCHFEEQILSNETLTREFTFFKMVITALKNPLTHTDYTCFKNKCSKCQAMNCQDPWSCQSLIFTISQNTDVLFQYQR